MSQQAFVEFVLNGQKLVMCATKYAFFIDDVHYNGGEQTVSNAQSFGACPVVVPA